MAELYDKENEEHIVNGYVLRNVKTSEHRGQYDAKTHRKLYDDPAKRKHFKEEQFGNKNTVDDIYTKNKLHKNADAADKKYGSNCANSHKTHVDHTTPIAVVYENMRDNPYVSNESIKNVANNEDNYKLTSGKFNQSKGAKTNSQYVKDNNITGEEERILLSEQRKSEKSILKGICKETVKGMNQVGLTSAKYGGAAGAVSSTIYNVQAIVNGDKDTIEAVVDVGFDTIKGASTAYVNSLLMKNCEWGMTSVANMIEKKTEKTAFEKLGNKISSKMLNVAKSDYLGMAFSIVMDTGKLMKLYLSGDITAEELMELLSQQAVSMSSSIWMGCVGGIVGGVLAGAPGIFIGDLIGSMVGGMLGTQIYKELVSVFKADENIGMYNCIANKFNEYNRSIEKMYNYMELYYADIIRRSFTGMRDAIMNNDIHNFSVCLDNICKMYGTKLAYENNKDFDIFWNNMSIKKEWEIRY